MALDSDEHPSRWSLFIEARDCLHGILAPRLTLNHLMAHGSRIAQRARRNRPKRPLQGVKLTRAANGL